MTKLEKLKNLVEDRGYKINNFHLGDYGIIVNLLGIEGGKLERDNSCSKKGTTI